MRACVKIIYKKVYMYKRQEGYIWAYLNTPDVAKTMTTVPQINKTTAEKSNKPNLGILSSMIMDSVTTISSSNRMFSDDDAVEDVADNLPSKGVLMPASSSTIVVVTVPATAG